MGRAWMRLVVLVMPVLVTILLAKAEGAAGAHQEDGWADFSGVDAFWRVESVLEGGGEPTAAQWDALFATPGYAELERRERRRATLELAFRLAYTPGMRAARDSALAAGGWLGFVLPHLVQVPGEHERIDSLRRTLGRSTVLQRARVSAARLLPPGATARALPPVSFLVFAPDGRGYPGRILVDILDYADQADGAAFFAHELFHYYRHGVPERALPADSTASPLTDFLCNVQEEGSADQLDKAAVPRASVRALDAMARGGARRSFLDAYRAAYVATPRWFARVDSAMLRAASQPDSAGAIGRTLQRDVPFGGRTLGAFMAAAIRLRSGDAALAATAGDAPAFWRAYDSVAGAPGAALPRLSPVARRALSQLWRPAPRRPRAKHLDPAAAPM